MDVALQYQLQNGLWAIGTVLFIIAGSLLVAHAAQWVARKRGATPAVQRKAYWGFLFASPWLLGFFIFVLGPALTSLYYSFTDYKLGSPGEWTGLDNYRQFILGEGAYGRRFKQAIFNSFYYAIVGVPLQIVAALGMAILLNQKMRGIKIFRLIFYTPVILAGGPAILLAWRYMLASNGGFINETMQSLARSFFLFDWLYRGFIYGMEAFNGLYAGLARGDPIGPFKYAIPALVAVLALLTLRGDWSPSKRSRALTIAEIVTVVVAFLLIGNGIVAEPVDPAWILVAAAGVLTYAALRASRGMAMSRRLMAGALVVLALIGAAVVAGRDAEAAPDVGPYLLALGAAAVPFIVGLLIPARSQTRLFGAAAVVFAVVLVAYVAPGQFGGDRWQLPFRYLTLNSALAQPGDADYLSDVYPAETMSAFWMYGAFVAVLLAAAVLGDRRDLLRRQIVTVALVVFALLLVGSALDGLRYFRAYDEVAEATGRPSYHFTLFRSSVATFPDNTRSPLWLNNELWSKPALVLITMWSSGAGMLIFLAALKGVPGSLYEAAEVDGASRLQKFFKITLPMISPAMFYNVVIGVIAALQTFEAVYILQRPETVDSVRSAAYFLYERTFREQAIGQGASLSWILAVIIVALTIMQFRYSNWVHYEV